MCQANNLSFKVSIKEEIVIDIRKRDDVNISLNVNGSEVEIVHSFRFLGVNITNNLSWVNHIVATAKKAH